MAIRKKGRKAKKPVGLGVSPGERLLVAVQRVVTGPHAKEAHELTAYYIRNHRWSSITARRARAITNPRGGVSTDGLPDGAADHMRDIASEN